MHISSMKRMEWFIKNYIEPCSDNIRVLDVGSYSVNGSYRELVAKYNNVEYVGLDIEAGPNVDVVVSDIYNWKELDDDSFDFIISGQAFEHIEYPWLTIKQIYSKLKSGGVTCIIAPSTIEEHRYPKDCYRYYGDGLHALAKWAGLKTIETTVGGIPSLGVDGWWDDRSNDAVLIARKEVSLSSEKKERRIFCAERRYLPVFDIKMQYEFLALLYESDKCQYIKKFILENNFSKIYVLGDGHVSKYIADYLELSENERLKSLGVMGNADGCSAVNFTTACIREFFSDGLAKDSLVIITEFDYNRDYIKYLKEYHGLENVYYAYDLIDFMTVSMLPGEKYIYGAGKFGGIVYNRLKKLNIKVAGFVVSDGHKQFNEYLGEKVLELREVDKEAGIIVGIEKSDEIIKKLKANNYFNFINGMDIISTWMYSKESIG